MYMHKRSRLALDLYDIVFWFLTVWLAYISLVRSQLVLTKITSDSKLSIYKCISRPVVLKSEVYIVLHHMTIDSLSCAYEPWSWFHPAYNNPFPCVFSCSKFMVSTSWIYIFISDWNSSISIVSCFSCVYTPIGLIRSTSCLHQVQGRKHGGSGEYFQKILVEF